MEAPVTVRAVLPDVAESVEAAVPTVGLIDAGDDDPAVVTCTVPFAVGDCIVFDG